LARSTDGEPIDPLIGLTVADRYRIDQRIGVGGMGTVYRGTHIRLGQNVAIKVLHERYAGDKKLTRRFEKEALTYGQVSHPNLVGLHDFGRTDDGTFYMVLEYCAGVSLSKFVREQGRVEPMLAADLILQIAQGLGQAHEQGIIHRDLKPENVILTETRPGCFHARLLDFGIAKRIDDDGPRLTQAGMVFGTPEYMAPEQARGKTVDARSDIYALGTMLYELLTGDPPFVGSDKLRIMHQQAHDVPPKPSHTIPGLQVPDTLEAITMKAIAKSPARRYQQTPDLIAALDTFCRSERGIADVSFKTNASPKPAGTDSAPLVLRASAPSRVSRASGLTTRAQSGVSFRNPSVGAATALCLAGLVLTAWGFFGGSDSTEAAHVKATPKHVMRSVGVTPNSPSSRSDVGKAKESKAEITPQKRAVSVAEKEKATRRAKEKARAIAKAQKIEADAKRRLKLSLKEASRLLKNGRFEGAAVRVEKLFKTHRRNPQVRLLRKQIISMRKIFQVGSVAYKSGHCAKAVSSMKRVLKVVPKYDKATTIIQNCQFASPPTQLN
jgi:serine/threonine protein kinase